MAMQPTRGGILARRPRQQPVGQGDPARMAGILATVSELDPSLPMPAPPQTMESGASTPIQTPRFDFSNLGAGPRPADQTGYAPMNMQNLGAGPRALGDQGFKQPMGDIMGGEGFDVGRVDVMPRNNQDIQPEAQTAANPEQRGGILGDIKRFLKTPEGRMAMMRSAGATLEGGLGAGILAGTEYYSKAKTAKEAAAEDARRYNVQSAQRDRQLGQVDTAETNRMGIAGMQNSTVQRGQDLGYNQGIYGIQAGMRNTDVNAGVSRANNQENNTTQRYGIQAGMRNTDANNARSQSNAELAAATQIETATISALASMTNAAQKGQGPAPTPLGVADAQKEAARMLPGLLNMPAADLGPALANRPELSAKIFSVVGNSVNPTTGKYDPELATQNLKQILAANGAQYRPGQEDGWGFGDSSRPAAITTARVPQEAIRRLQANPALAAEFDRKYGAGASQRALDGR